MEGVLVEGIFISLLVATGIQLIILSLQFPFTCLCLETFSVVAGGGGKGQKSHWLSSVGATFVFIVKPVLCFCLCEKAQVVFS